MTFILSLAGCVTMIKNACNTNAAYSRGINDAQDGFNMQQNYASLCPVRQVKINRAYRRGYLNGMKHRKPLRPMPYVYPHPWQRRFPHRGRAY